MLTVAICTYNRADSLAGTLASLASQSQIDWTDVEVLIVDNNCTDRTAQVVQEAAARLPIRRVAEARQGLANARNRALAEARGEWVVFTDDDVLLDPIWLRSYLEAFDRFPHAEFAGGRIVPHWPEGAPGWFKGRRLSLLDGVLGWYDLDGGERIMGEHDMSPYGANFALRRTLFEREGPFRPDLGVVGSAIGRGEETEYFARARSSGVAGAYVPAATARHLLHARRFAPLALYRHGLAVGRAHREIADPHAVGSNGRALLFLVRGLLQLVRGRGDRFRQCMINVGIQRALAVRAPSTSAR